eukprot:2669964-Rhodomonas_salina.1
MLSPRPSLFLTIVVSPACPPDARGSRRRGTRSQRRSCWKSRTRQSGTRMPRRPRISSWSPSAFRVPGLGLKI